MSGHRFQLVSMQLSIEPVGQFVSPGLYLPVSLIMEVRAHQMMRILKFQSFMTIYPIFQSFPITGMINTFLSWKGFVPLAKLSFMIYLLHFPILWWRYAYLRERLAFGHYTMVISIL